MSDVNLNIYEGYLDWAQDYYGWVVAKYPKQWLAYQGRADAFVTNHQLESAIPDYDQAVKLAPKEAILYFRRGMAHTKLGNSHQAETDFQKVIMLSRKSHLQRRAKQLLAENSSVQPLPE
jgi:tetratricopeptide (TPR) repeat protein